MRSVVTTAIHNCVAGKLRPLRKEKSLYVFFLSNYATFLNICLSHFASGTFQLIRLRVKKISDIMIHALVVPCKSKTFPSRDAYELGLVACGLI